MYWFRRGLVFVALLILMMIAVALVLLGQSDTDALWYRLLIIGGAVVATTVGGYGSKMWIVEQDAKDQIREFLRRDDDDEDDDDDDNDDFRVRPHRRW